MNGISYFLFFLILLSFSHSFLKFLYFKFLKIEKHNLLKELVIDNSLLLLLILLCSFLFIYTPLIFEKYGYFIFDSTIGKLVLSTFALLILPFGLSGVRYLVYKKQEIELPLYSIGLNVFYWVVLSISVGIFVNLIHSILFL